MFRRLISRFCVLSVLTVSGFSQAPGSLDPSFDPSSGSATLDPDQVLSVSLLDSGEVMIAGDFTIGGVRHARVARLNSSGSLDTRFTPLFRADNEVLALAVQPDRKILIAGRFTNVDNSERNYIARLNEDGSLDTSFDPKEGPNFDVTALRMQSDGKVLIAGSFDLVDGQIRNGLARLNSNGSLDAGFNPQLAVGSFVGAIVVQSNKVVVSQLLANTNLVQRLNSDGSRDGSFQSSAFEGEILALASQPDDRLLVAGSFNRVGSVTRNRIARLDPSGALDASFDPGAGPNGDILAVALQPDLKIIVAGNFDRFNETRRAGVARLLPSGALDAVYNQGPGVDGSVNTIALQPDGRLLLGGFVSSVDGVPRDSIARLLGDVAGPATGPLLGDPKRNANTFSLSFPSMIGKTYTLEAADTVVGNFASVGSPQLGNGTTLTLADAGATSSVRFYRVRVQ